MTQQGNHAIAAVSALVYWPDRGSILMLKKLPHKHQGGRWGNLGGKHDFGETSVAAAWRELREEGGPDLNPENLEYFGFGGICEDCIPAIGKHYVAAIHLFRVRAGRVPVAVNAEPGNHEAVEWFKVYALPSDLTDAFRAVVAALAEDQVSDVDAAYHLTDALSTTLAEQAWHALAAAITEQDRHAGPVDS